MEFLCNHDEFMGWSRLSCIKIVVSWSSTTVPFTEWCTWKCLIRGHCEFCR